MIALYYAKSVIRNRSLFFWGIAFMGFWLFMGAFLFGYVPSGYTFDLDYTSTWFSIIALFSISTIGTTVAYSLYYANSSLNFAFRFTGLGIRDFMISIISAVITASFLLGSIMLALSAALFSIRSGRLVLPAMPYYSILASISGGIIMFSISGCMTVIVNNFFTLKNINFLSLFTTILSYIFGFSQISVALPVWMIYGNPFSEIVDLLYFSYSGADPHQVLTNSSSPFLSLTYLSAGLILWIGFLCVIFISLIPGLRPVPVEEARQI